MNIKDVLDELLSKKIFEKKPAWVEEGAVAKMEEAVKAYYADFFGKETAEKNWALPVDYAEYLHSFTGLIKDKENLNKDIYDSSGTSDATTQPWWKYEMSELKKRCKTGEFFRNDTMWLSIGWWGDKHEIFLCCDKMHENFGKVFDCHDGTPWNGDDDSYIDEYDSFTEFLIENLEDEEEDEWDGEISGSRLI
ncbi:MAG: hypothetical protein OEZ34_09285 [Spirochaetia bacterium]|nr:hypothetical protein [Spirochaetia bacterium]